jgi:pentatricopeptide repeat protein
VRKSIDARSGSSRVGIVEIEGNAARRASIAFPTIRPVESSTPRQSTITPRGLARTRSTVDLWALPSTSPRPGLGIRALSTRSTSIPLPEVELESEAVIAEEVFVSRSLPSATPALKQPNRVLMDLAGLDTPRRLDRTQSRRYSIGAVQQSEVIPEESEPAFEESEISAGESDSPANLDRAIFIGIIDRRNKGQDCEALINHYRAPRDSSSLDSRLQDRYPLPPGYDVRTYNLILETYLKNRTAGSSIAPILEAYNEMLDRDVVPNIKTYNEVIRALALREADVQSAVKRFEEHQAWAQWRSRNMGDEYDEATWAEKRSVVDGYVAEGNLNSALRLLAASRAMGTRDYAMKWTETTTAFHLPVLSAIALQQDISAKDLDIALQIFQDAGHKRLSTRRTLFGPLATILGKGGVEAKGRLEGLWEEFMDGEKAGVGLRNSDWGTAKTNQNARSSLHIASTHRRTVWINVATAFVKLGEVEKAKEIIRTSIESGPREGAVVEENDENDEKAESGLNSGASQQTWSTPEPTQVIYPVMIALAEERRFEDVRDIFDTTFSFVQGRSPFGERYTAHSVRTLLNTLLVADQLELALHITTSYTPLLTPETSSILQPTRQVLYALLDHKASMAASQEEAVALLERVPTFQAPEPGQKRYFDMNGAARHVFALLQAGQAERINEEIRVFFSDQPIVYHPALFGEGQIEITDLAEHIVKEESLALQAKLAILERFISRRPFSSYESSAKRLLQQYQAERAASPTKPPLDLHLTPRSWSRVVQMVAQLPAESFAEGEHDEVLQTLMGDLAALSSQDYDYFSKSRVANEETMSTLAALLVDRFGRDRATEMLSPVSGATGALLSLETPAPATSGSEADTTIQTPETSDVESLGSFRPSSPQYVAPEQPLQGDSTLRITDRASQDIDRHTFRNPQISPLEAYDNLEQRLRSGETASPDAIARLLDNVGRTGLENEHKVHKLYSLGQHLVSTLPVNAQIQPWWLLENAMLIATCHLGYLEQAGLHRAQLVEAGYPPGPDAYATMIACAKDTTDDALVARELWDESRAVGVKANMFLYNTIISKLSKARKAEMALELFKHMKVSGIRPSSVTYGAVIVSATRLKCRVKLTSWVECLLSCR